MKEKCPCTSFIFYLSKHVILPGMGKKFSIPNLEIAPEAEP